MNRSQLYLALLIIGILSLAQLIQAQSGISAHVELSSSPPENTKVAPESTVTYFMDITIAGMTGGEITVSVSSSNVSQYLSCADPEPHTTRTNGYLFMDVVCTIVKTVTADTNIPTPSFTVTVDGIATSITDPHAGFTVDKDFAEQTTSGTAFEVSAAQHPDRVLNGGFDTNDTFQTRIDGKDMTYTEIQLNRQPNNPSTEATYPDNHSGDGYNRNYVKQISLPCSGKDCSADSVIDVNCGSNCRTYVDKKECVVDYYSVVPFNDNDPDPTPTLYYNPSPSAESIEFLSSLSSGVVQTAITVTLPVAFPRLEFVDAKDVKKTKTYAQLPQPATANELMHDGGSFSYPQIDWQSHAIQNGPAGTIDVSITGEITETSWEYREINRVKPTCVYYYTRTYDCDTDDCPEERKRVESTMPSFPIFAWKRTSTKKVPINVKGIAVIDVFSSAAWIQTKGGNIGTNNKLNLTGTGSTGAFKYSSGDALIDADNYRTELVSATTSAAGFTPQNQYNADFMIYAKQLVEGTGTLTSRSNWQTEFDANNIFHQNEVKDYYGYKKRGDEYDRADHKRNFTADLRDRQIFGEVIDFSTLSSEELAGYGTITKTGSTYTITDSLRLDRGHIYYFPPGSTVNLGARNGNDLKLTGHPARLHVEDDTVKILGNIVYATSEAVSYLDIPNLRIDAKEIRVDGDVEYIESQLRAKDFYSGDSEKQLRILGDVIAGTAHFQRRPVNVFNAEDFAINPPAELIVEDYRKYVIPAPGDTQLRSADYAWQQVNPYSGEVIDPY